VESKIKNTISSVVEKVGLGNRKDSKPFSYFDIIDILEHPGCPICNLLDQKSDRYLGSIFTEMLLDPDTHQAFRARRGLCAQHSARAAEYIGGSLEIAMLFAAGLEEVVQALSEGLPSGSGNALKNLAKRNGKQTALERRLAPTAACMVCSYLHEAEKRYIDTLGKHIHDPKVSKAFEDSEGLCLPHFRMALVNMSNDSARERLISIHKEIWTTLKDDLESFIAKNNYLHKHEINPREGDSWRKVTRIAGKSGVFGLDRF
jgi:hypothetical protein